MTPEAPKKKRTRSPNYPVIDLETAIGRAGALHGKYDTHPIPIGMAQGHWKYKGGSSMAEQTVAALRAYGLLNVTGKADARKVSVSQAGDRITRNAPDRDKLIQDAAVLPKIHAELWDKYKNKGLPHDDVIQTYLLWEREEGLFNKDVVDGVISRFRATIAFAKLEQSDILDGGEQDDNGDDGTPSEEETEKRKVRKVATAVLPLPVPMEDGTIRIVDIPRMTSATFAFFTKQLEAYKSAIVLPPAADTSSDKSSDD